MLNNWDTKKKTNIFIIFTVLTVLIAYGLFSPSGIINRVMLTNRNSDLKQELSYEEKVKDSLYNEINKLRYDTAEIEKIAREKFGMKKPNEKIYIIPQKK